MTDETTQALLPVKVTQADRDLIVTLMRPLAKSAIEHKAIDFIAEGRGDDAEAVQIVAKHRLAHSLPSQADAGERSKIVAWLRSIDEGPLKGWQPNALANAIERGDYFRLAEESLAVDQLQAMGQDFDATSGEEMRLREALAALLTRDMRNTCQHENTHRGGSIWEICDDCGWKWADDEGGKPEWQDPPEWVEARAALTKGAE